MIGGFLAGVLERVLHPHRPRPVPESDLERTLPMTVVAFPAGWDWQTPQQWEAEHGGRDDR